MVGPGFADKGEGLGRGQEPDVDEVAPEIEASLLRFWDLATVDNQPGTCLQGMIVPRGHY